MLRWIAVAAVACVAAACGGGPTGPTGPTGPPRLSRTRFMAFGDSLTAGEVTAPISRAPGFTTLVVVPASSYPTNLQSQLQAAYPGQSSAIGVNNQGRSGETVFDGAVRFEQVFAETRPEAVLIQEGVNGISNIGATASTAVIRSMVQRAQNGLARVFVGSMIPTIAGRQRSQDATALLAYNTALQAMCREEGVIYVDLYNGILPDVGQLIGVDGLHPNEAGYRRIADVFLTAVRGALEQR